MVSSAQLGLVGEIPLGRTLVVGFWVGFISSVSISQEESGNVWVRCGEGSQEGGVGG